MIGTSVIKSNLKWADARWANMSHLNGIAQDLMAFCLIMPGLIMLFLMTRKSYVV